MRRLELAITFAALSSLTFHAARAQSGHDSSDVPHSPAGWQAFAATYGAPGNYGMAYGSPGFGLARTYSSYSSSYGGGYAYGHAPYRFLPNAYGMGLWRPSAYPSAALEGTGFYRTYPVPDRAQRGVPVPPVGAYAPGFGPTPPGSW